MQNKTNRQLYEKFHENRKHQRRIVNRNDFTHGPLIELLDERITNTSVILDIGCGTGAIDFYLAEKGNNITGIDISEKAIKICNENANNLNLANKTSFEVNTIEGFKTNNKFDVVLLIEVIEHVENDVAAIKKISTLLNPKGRLILSTPSINAPLYKIGFLNNFDKRVGHLRRYSSGELVKKLSNFFIIEETIKTEGFIRNFMYTSTIGGEILLKLINRSKILANLIKKIDSFALRLFGESDIIIVAKKK